MQKENNTKSGSNRPAKDNLKIIPLGGVEEIGINCTAFEYKERIVVIDMGLGFPDANMYGVDYIVPNVDYLIKNKKKIEGVVITHGHLDHIGALPYLLPMLDFPEVYGTEFTIELIKNKLEDHKILNKAKLNVVTIESILTSADFKIEFFRVNHSIPQAVGVVIETPAAKVVHTGDFKFDNSPVNEPVADYARIANIGLDGVDLLLSDSTNSLKKGHPASESDVAKSLSEIVERAKGRVIIASFSGLVGRLYQVIKVAEQQNRKVAIAGYSMNKTFQIAQDIGYIKPKPGVIIPVQKVNRFNDDRVVILTTGSQGESNAALARMANEEYRRVTIKKGDTVVLSAGTIPGNNLDVQNLIDAITAKGASVHQSENLDFFTSGHGYQEDQKIMLNLIKPTYFMPVHGYQYFLREHGRTAVTVGVKENNVIISKRGSVIEGNKEEGFKVTSQLTTTPKLVSGAGVGDIGTAVLTERHQLGNHGVVIVDINVDSAKRTLLAPPHVYTKGFVYVKTSHDVISEIQSIAAKTLEKNIKKKMEIAELRESLEKVLAAFVEKETGRTPAIIPMISFLNVSQGPKPRQPQQQREKPQHRKPQKPHKVSKEHIRTEKDPVAAKSFARKWKINQESMDVLPKDK